MKRKTLTRAPYTGAPFGHTGAAAPAPTGPGVAVFPTGTDARLSAWFFDSQALTLEQGETFTGAVHKIDRVTLAPDASSGLNSTFTIMANNDAGIAEITVTGSAVTIKALKAGKAAYTLLSGDKSVTCAFTITVTPKAVAAPAQITQQPAAAITVDEGKALSISVTATGATGYQWQKLDADGKTWKDLPGKTADTLAESAAAAGNAGSYRVIVKGAPGSADQVSSVSVVSITIKPADHLNLTESGTAPGTLTDYADGSQTLSIEAGNVFMITVQRISAATGAAVNGGGNNFIIADAGSAVVAESIHSPKDTTNKRTLQITGKTPGTSTVALTSADGKAAVKLIITVTPKGGTAVKATGVAINDITESKSGGKVGAKMRGLHLGQLNDKDEYFYSVTPPDATGYTVKWEITEPDGTPTDKATIDPVTGDITCIKNGDTLLKLTLTNADGSTVTDTEPYQIYSKDPFAIRSPSLDSMAVGDTQDFKTAENGRGFEGNTNTPDNFLANVIGTISFAFDSDDKDAAEVDASGIITAKALSSKDKINISGTVTVVSNGTTFTGSDSSSLTITA